ncbi:hypothetical protein HWV62_45472 [Athelia sp. TMB]|nr:hypothetical protein HWV62_45472 [Athelia sp. TMB]
MDICMDNTANCDTMAKWLPMWLPLYRGLKARGRCFPHIINLVAKIFISFFFKKPKKCKAITVAAGTSRHHSHTQTVAGPALHVDTKFVLEGGECDAKIKDATILEEAEISVSAVVKDDRCDAHNEAVENTLWGQAI